VRFAIFWLAVVVYAFAWIYEKGTIIGWLAIVVMVYLAGWFRGESSAKKKSLTQ